MQDIFSHTAPKLVRRLERNKSAYQTFKTDMLALKDVSSPADDGWEGLFSFIQFADYVYSIGNSKAFGKILTDPDPETRSGFVAVLRCMVDAADSLDAIIRDDKNYTGPVARKLRGEL